MRSSPVFGYMLKMAWPANWWCCIRSRRIFVAWQLGLAVLVVGGLSVLAVRHAKKLPYLFTGWFWFSRDTGAGDRVGSGGAPVDGRPLHVCALIGLFIVIAWGGHELARALATPVWGACRPGDPARFLACIPVTRAQLAYWKDSVTLLEHALRLDCGQLCRGE